MSAPAKKWIERGKSVLIVLLMLSMTVLFLLTWSTDSESLPDSVRGVVNWVGHLFGGREQSSPVVLGSRADTYGDAVFPVSAAISDDGALRAVFAPDSQLDELYAALRPVVADCLASVEPPSRMTEVNFNAALESSNGVFVKYSSTVRCSLLALSHGVEFPPEGGILADRLFLSAEDRYITLYAGGNGEYRRFATSVESARLNQFKGYDRGVAADWSFDIGFDGSPAVYPSGDLRIPTAQAGSVPTGEGAVQTMLSAFSMNPETYYRYTSSAGTQYAVEETRVLAIGADGSISYTDSSPAALSAGRSEEQLVERCRRLLAAASQGSLGDGRFSLRTVEGTAEGRMEVRFGYTLGALPVYVDGARDGAVFILENGALKEAHITLRRYTFDGSAALMMPPAAAAAIGSDEPCYYDDLADGQLAARWAR